MKCFEMGYVTLVYLWDRHSVMLLKFESLWFIWRSGPVDAVSDLQVSLGDLDSKGRCRLAEAWWRNDRDYSGPAVWAQPMRDGVTMKHRVSLAEPIPRMITATLCRQAIKPKILMIYILPLGPWVTNFNENSIKNTKLFPRKCIWKCCLQDLCHFVETSITVPEKTTRVT